MQAFELDFERKNELQANLLQLKANLRAHEIETPDPALYSVQKFAAANSQQQQLILNNISTYLQILSQRIEPERPNVRIQEIARLKWAMRSFNLEAKDDDVFNTVSEDDIIEIYDAQGVQLYRNIRFFKFCSYSLLDLAINTWDQLYDKPSFVIQKTMEAIERARNSNGEPVAYNIPTYLQKEKFKPSLVHRTLKVTPNFLVPLRDPTTKSFAGAFSTYTAETVAEGHESFRYTIL